MLRGSMPQKLFKSFLGDPFYSQERFVEVVLRFCSSGFPKECFKLWMLEFLVHIFIQVTQTISMRRTRKHKLYSFEETFLTITDKDKMSRNEECGSMLCDHSVKKADKPE